MREVLEHDALVADLLDRLEPLDHLVDRADRRVFAVALQDVLWISPEERAKIVELLNPQDIAVTLSENFMLVPEQSTDALIVHHPEAKYFSA